MEQSYSLAWVPPGKHTAEDLRLVLEADDAQPLIERIPLETIDMQLRLGTMQLFRVVPGPGVMLTEIRHKYGIKRLSLIRGAGRCAWQLKSIMKLLAITAQEWGCECVETVVYSQRLKRALELSGASVEGYAMTYALEADHGNEE